MYLQRKNQHCIFILSVLFCSKTEKHYNLCSAGPSLGAKLGLPDEFSQKMFPITPPGNGNVGLGPRDLSEFHTGGDSEEYNHLCRKYANNNWAWNGTKSKWFVGVFVSLKRHSHFSFQNAYKYFGTKQQGCTLHTRSFSNLYLLQNPC